MKHRGSILMAALLGLGLLGCDSGPGVTSPTLSVVPRLDRASGLDDSLWERAKTVHLQLRTSAGDVQDQYVPFRQGGCRFKGIPGDQGYVITAEGLDSLSRVVWSGSASALAGDTRGSLVIRQDIVVSAPASQPSSKGQVEAVSTDLDTGSYDHPVTIHLRSPTVGATIRYTLDGSAPTSSSPVYRDSLRLDSSAIVTAVAARDGMVSSSNTTFRFTLQVEPILLSVDDTAEMGVLVIGLACRTLGATLRYTLDGTEPEGSDPLYVDSLRIYASDSVRLSVAAFSPPGMKLEKRILNNLEMSSPLGFLADPRDGKIYRTVDFGGLRWMTENLDYNRFGSSWSVVSLLPKEQQASFAASHPHAGRLYTVTALSGIPDSCAGLDCYTYQGKLPSVCPEGWRYPTQTELLPLRWNAVAVSVDLVGTYDSLQESMVHVDSTYELWSTSIGPVWAENKAYLGRHRYAVRCVR